jgi:hypothetical protein
MSQFTIAGPPWLIDGRRVYRGRPPLTRLEQKTINLVERFGAQICHEKGETNFWSNGVKLRRATVRRLMQLKRLLVAEDGLLPGMGQTLLVNTTTPTNVHGGPAP